MERTLFVLLEYRPRTYGPPEVFYGFWACVAIMLGARTLRGTALGAALWPSAFTASGHSFAVQLAVDALLLWGMLWAMFAFLLAGAKIETHWERRRSARATAAAATGRAPTM